MPPWCNIVLPRPSFLVLNNRTFQILFVLHYSSIAREVKDNIRTHSALIMHTDPDRSGASRIILGQSGVRPEKRKGSVWG